MAIRSMPLAALPIHRSQHFAACGLFSAVSRASPFPYIHVGIQGNRDCTGQNMRCKALALLQEFKVMSSEQDEHAQSSHAIS
jgi:hypothetical protein